MNESIRKLKPFINIPVGEFIKEELEYRGWNQDDLAIIMQTTPKTINQIINGKQGITVQTAIKLGKVFGQSPEYWLNLHNIYHIREAEDNHPKSKSNISELTELFENISVSDSVKKGWLPKTKDSEKLKKYINQIGINKASCKFVARTGNLENKSKVAGSTWISFAEYGAKYYPVPAYDETKLKGIAKKISEYTILPNGVEKIITDLNNSGVGFFTLTHLPKSYLDGAVFSYKNNPYVVYTHRYDREDNFWFTLAHELAHIILHYKDSDLCILDNEIETDSKDKREIEADDLAKKLLKRDQIINLLYKLKFEHNMNLKEQIESCSKEIGICKSIIVGMYQYNFKALYRNKILNGMKKTITNLLPDKYNMDKILEKEALQA